MRSSFIVAALCLVSSVSCQPAGELRNHERGVPPIRMQPAIQAAEEALTAAKQAVADDLAAFERARETYRARKVKGLAALDKKIAELEAASVGKIGAAKESYDASLTKIRARRAQLALDVRAIDGTASEAWDAMIKKLDVEAEELSKLIDHAPAALLIP